MIEQYAPAKQTVYCEMEQGEAILLHNWLLHSSDKNASPQSRRAFSVCYMDARTTDEQANLTGTRIFEDALEPAESR